jgi:hypothetical protein
MFCNRRSLVAAKKKRKRVNSWVGTFRKCFEKGGGLVQAMLDNCVAIFRKCYHSDTSDFEPCMHIYLQQSLPKHLEKKPMKRKEK